MLPGALRVYTRVLGKEREREREREREMSIKKVIRPQRGRAV
jgi:hypothetical protein